MHAPQSGHWLLAMYNPTARAATWALPVHGWATAPLPSSAAATTVPVPSTRSLPPSYPAAIQRDAHHMDTPARPHLKMPLTRCTRGATAVSSAPSLSRRNTSSGLNSHPHEAAAPSAAPVLRPEVGCSSCPCCCCCCCCDACEEGKRSGRPGASCGTELAVLVLVAEGPPVAPAETPSVAAPRA